MGMGMGASLPNNPTLRHMMGVGGDEKCYGAAGNFGEGCAVNHVDPRKAANLPAGFALPGFREFAHRESSPEMPASESVAPKKIGNFSAPGQGQEP